MARLFYIEDNPVVGKPAIMYEDSQPAGYTLIVDLAELKKCYISKYKERECGGVIWFEEFRADLMIDIIEATYTGSEVFLLEQHLKALTVNVVAGNWLTAQSCSTNLALSGIYNQTMKDEIQAVIDSYVVNNY